MMMADMETKNAPHVNKKRHDKQVFSSDDIHKCQTDDKKWLCPIDGCGKTLSRKQTLQGHLFSMHSISIDYPPKRYKLYETDESIPVPKSTTYYWKSKHGCSTTEDASGSTGLVTRSENWIPTIEDQAYPQREENGDCEAVNEHINFEHVEVPPVLIDRHSDGSDMDICSDSSEDGLAESEDSLSDEENPISAGCISEGFEENTSPPVYVIQQGAPTFESLTRQQHILATTAFATRHNLSDTAIKDLLSLLQLHFPESNIGEKNVRTMKQLCGFNDAFLHFHTYCSACNKLFIEAETCETPGCGNAKKSQNYFVTGDVHKQLKEVLELEDIWEAIKENRKINSNRISDITSGSEYMKLKTEGGFLYNTDNVTLTFFTDGIPLFKSTGISLWPVYLIINEIPPKQRFLRKHMILWGLWQGISKPNMNMFLRPLITDLLGLYHEGIAIYKSSVPVKAMLVVATMDLPARAYVLQMTQHNGKFGCVYCTEEGEVVKSGRGTCRSYPFKDPPLLPATQRLHSEIINSAERAEKDGTRHFGILGKSVMLYLTYFKFPINIVIDYMHGILLGVTKKLLSLWLEPENAGEGFFIGRNMNDLDEAFRTVQPPYMIHRVPRKIKGNYHRWKASELRSWLLFYSLPCLKGNLPTVYLTHFSCLVEGTYILLGEEIEEKDLVRAEWLFHSFVRNSPLLYRENIMGINVHNLLHIVDCVRNWGPMWAWSCFAFESFNGEIKKGVHGTGNVCRQIFWHLLGQKAVETYLHSENCHGATKDFIHNLSEGRSSRLPCGVKAFQCVVVKLRSAPVFDEEILAQLRFLTGTMDTVMETFMTASKIVRNGYLMYSRKCSKVKKRNSYTIKLVKPMGDKVSYVEVLQYIYQTTTKHVFAVCKLLRQVESVVPRRVNHLQRLEYSSTEIKLIRAEALHEPAVAVQTGSELYAGILPNHIERD